MATDGTEREVDGTTVRLTNLDKPLWPDAGVTKGDLVDHWVRVAPLVLPHLTRRPLTLVRAPDGIDGQRWYQKDAGGGVPDHVRTAELSGVEEGDVAHVVADDAATLAALAQLAAVELHVGPCPVDDLDHPAELVLDLDPPDRRDTATRRATRLVGDLLTDELGLRCFVKATGSAGFHVHVPLDGSADVATVRDLAEDVGRLLAARHPDELTIESRTEDRGDRVYVDWLRNHPAQTAVVPYSPRALADAPVAAPLDWDELSDGVAPDQFTMRTVFRRLGQRDDPWQGMRDAVQSLDEAVERMAELRAPADDGD